MFGPDGKGREKSRDKSRKNEYSGKKLGKKAERGQNFREDLKLDV